MKNYNLTYISQVCRAETIYSQILKYGFMSVKDDPGFCTQALFYNERLFTSMIIKQATQLGFIWSLISEMRIISCLMLNTV